MNNMKITLGTSGPTDCCLTLHNQGSIKEYGIESDAWNKLSEYWNIVEQSGEIPEEIGLQIWHNNDKDLVDHTW